MDIQVPAHRQQGLSKCLLRRAPTLAKLSLSSERGRTDLRGDQPFAKHRDLTAFHLQVAKGGSYNTAPCCQETCTKSALQLIGASAPSSGNQTECRNPKQRINEFSSSSEDHVPSHTEIFQTFPQCCSVTELNSMDKQACPQLSFIQTPTLTEREPGEDGTKQRTLWSMGYNTGLCPALDRALRSRNSVGWFQS